jgi:hypothetical protein
MWTSRDISLNIEMVDGDEVIVVLTTPAGTLRIPGGVSRRERVLHVNRAPIEASIQVLSGAPDLMGSAESSWRKPMSTKLSLKEVLERRGVTQEGPPERSSFPTVKLILSIDSVDRPVTVIRLLATHGLGLKKAHAAMDRLAERGCVAVEVPTDDPASVIAELSQLNVHAVIEGSVGTTGRNPGKRPTRFRFPNS